MTDADEVGPDDWRQKALRELEAAVLLRDQQLWEQAFDHAGLAIEFALKARIMRHTGMNRWPTRKERPELHVHQLQSLARHAGLSHVLVDVWMDDSAPGILEAWLVAKDWSHNLRYTKSFPRARAEDMVRAVEGGLLAWLLN